MKETFVHGPPNCSHSADVGSFLSRLPKLVAAWLTVGTSSMAAAAANGTSFFMLLLSRIASPRRSSHLFARNASRAVLGSPYRLDSHRLEADMQSLTARL